MDLKLTINEERVKAGVYIHFPYCIRKCDYCDFFSHPLSRGSVPFAGKISDEFLGSYKGSLIREIRYRAENHPHLTEFSSVYFGGGTPSLMPVETVSEILDELRKQFRFTDDCEITLEGNPENLTPDYLQSLSEAGVNRVHAGIQSFDENNLKKVNRFHNPDRYATVIEDLGSSPVASKGIDLIYGFPGQDSDNFFEDLEKAFHPGIDHISLYSLTAEMGTPYNDRINSGLVAAPDEEIQARILRILPEYMSKRDFHGYEISNFSRPGKESRHNLAYWLYRPYLGFGPSAHGFDGKVRYSNPSKIEQYLVNPVQAEYQMHDPFLEFPLGYLRLRRPFSVSGFIAKFNETGRTSADPVLMKVFRHWAEEDYGSLESHNGDLFFQWNQKGILTLDSRILEMVHETDSAGR